MNKWYKVLSECGFVVLMAVMLGLSGCQEAEDAGQETEEGLEEIGDATLDATEEAGDEIEDATDKADDEL
jgi:hypothetical protein